MISSNENNDHLKKIENACNQINKPLKETLM